LDIITSKFAHFTRFLIQRFFFNIKDLYEIQASTQTCDKSIIDIIKNGSTIRHQNLSGPVDNKKRPVLNVDCVVSVFHYQPRRGAVRMNRATRYLDSAISPK
jgi:hypothetical protein